MIVSFLAKFILFSSFVVYIEEMIIRICKKENGRVAAHEHTNVHLSYTGT